MRCEYCCRCDCYRNDASIVGGGVIVIGTFDASMVVDANPMGMVDMSIVMV